MDEKELLKEISSKLTWIVVFLGCLVGVSIGNLIFGNIFGG